MFTCKLSSLLAPRFCKSLRATYTHAHCELIRFAFIIVSSLVSLLRTLLRRMHSRQIVANLFSVCRPLYVGALTAKAAHSQQRGPIAECSSPVIAAVESLWTVGCSAGAFSPGQQISPGQETRI